MKIALIQFNAGSDKDININRAKAFVQEAASGGASWILLPEVFSLRGNFQNKEILKSAAEDIPGPTTQIFQEIAKQLNIDILLGSILEQSHRDKVYNTSVAISKSSETVEKYRKIHLFDAIVGDKIVHEADFFEHGLHGETISVQEFTVGLSVCYDLRFSELYQNYARQKVNVLTVPSCFTKITGQAHWESLLRSRAIENLSYVLAPNQVGADAKGIEAYGHSMVIGPWGEVIVEASADKEEIIYAEISLEVIKEARRKLPGIIK